MNFKVTLEAEKDKLEKSLDGYTVKKIQGINYLYRQWREGSKVVSDYIGRAKKSQIGAGKRLRLVKWLLKNQNKFIEGLKLLKELQKKAEEEKKSS